MLFKGFLFFGLGSFFDVLVYDGDSIQVEKEPNLRKADAGGVAVVSSCRSVMG